MSGWFSFETKGGTLASVRKDQVVAILQLPDYSSELVLSNGRVVPVRSIMSYLEVCSAVMEVKP